MSALLFIIFINDINQAISNSNFLLYIDDQKIFKTITSEDNITMLIIENVVNWLEKNGLNFNIDKCKIIIFSNKEKTTEITRIIKNKKIECVSTIKDLGIIFDNRMTFNYHIDHVLAKARKRLYLLKKQTYSFKNINTIKLIYNTHLKSTLMYGSTIWSPKTNETIYELEKIQNNFLRYVSYKTNEPMSFMEHDFTEIRKKTDLKSLEKSRIDNDLIFLNKIINNYIEIPSLLTDFQMYNPPEVLRKTDNRNNIIFVPNNILHKKSITYRLTELANKYSKLNKNFDLNIVNLYSFKKILSENLRLETT